MLPTGETCWQCGTAFNPHLKKCGRCGKAYYCSKDCQKKHWKSGHKRNCQPPQPISIPVTELEKKTPLDVTKIPNEVWIKFVFKYLSNKDIFRVSRVCKHFNTISFDAVKELNLSINEDSILYKTSLGAKMHRHWASNAISRFRGLESLKISDGNESGQITANDVWDKEKKLNVKLSRVPNHTSMKGFMNYKTVIFQTGFFPGFFLSIGINHCSKLKHIYLKGVNFLSKDFLSILDFEILEKIQDVINVHDTPMNPNSMFLVAIAYKCVNLESLLIEDLDYLSSEAINILLTEHSSSLKALRICGNNITDDMLQALPLCQKLELFEIVQAYKLGPNGFGAISKLHNLKSLEIQWACATDVDTGENNGLNAKHFISLFANDNMPHLEKLNLDGSDALYLDSAEDDIFKVFYAIAKNCQKLKYGSFYKGQLIPQECFGILIRNLPYLSYLFLRKCYEVDIDYLRRVMRQSPSSCLKINHLDGIITWNNAGHNYFRKVTYD